LRERAKVLVVRLSVLFVALCCSIVLIGRASPRAAATSDRIWFCPGPGTLDMIRLFEHPEEWAHARQLMSVFKFYQQQTVMPADPIVGPNSYDALARANAFRLLGRWGKKIAIEAGSVKEFLCTPDASGMTESIARTVQSIRSVQNAGGQVAYIAMDEPFVSGRAKVCGGPALEPTADRVATYVAGVHAAFPQVRIGLIEAYPFSSADAIENILQLLTARGVTPAFLHMDVDWHFSGGDPFVRDMPRLKRAADTARIPFGIILTGYNGDADALYGADVETMTDLVARTFGTWNTMPDQLIFQSWAESQSGLRITPTNLPEDRPYTHTGMLWDVFRRLRGANGAATGSAVRRQ
jgi:hypothetical protein